MLTIAATQLKNNTAKTVYPNLNIFQVNVDNYVRQIQLIILVIKTLDI